MNQFFNILVTLLLSTTLFGNAADSTSLDLNDITLTLTNFLLHHQTYKNLLL